jgi:hypothetical protein
MARSILTIYAATTTSILTFSATALAVDCFVDSVDGNDTNTGLSEDSALQSPTKVGSTCTVIKFKRGSVFNVAKGENAVNIGFGGKITTLTNYGDPNQPIPRFVKKREPNSGGMISAYSGNLTIDGLSFSGSQSDANMANLAQGIGIMIGGNSKITNSEITNCDIGIMTTGDNVKVLNNYIHDLFISVDAPQGVDPNAVGGAEGIFVNSSHVEVAYNRFINCSTKAAWTGGSCDGGATEVTATNGKAVTDVMIHHNFSYNSCGFFEVSTTFDSSSSGTFTKGMFQDSAFYNNVMIDSGWISLLQVNNTDLKNIRWENNTIVHHKGSMNAGMMAVVYTSTSSGTSGGALAPDSVFWTNNLWVFEPGIMSLEPDKNFVQDGNLIIKDSSKQDPGFVNLAGTTNPVDFDLVVGSPAIDYTKTVLTETALDFLNRASPDPTSGRQDAGAFEYNSVLSGSGGNSNTGGGIGAGGSTILTTTTSAITGGTTATATISHVTTSGGKSNENSGESSLGGSSSNGSLPDASEPNSATSGSESGCNCMFVRYSTPKLTGLGLMTLITVLLRRARKDRKLARTFFNPKKRP